MGSNSSLSSWRLTRPRKQLPRVDRKFTRWGRTMASKSWKRLQLITVGLVAALALTVAVPTTAAASDARNPVPGTVEVQLTTQQTKDVEAIAFASDFTRSTFDATRAMSLGASPDSVADAAAVLAGNGWTIDGMATTRASEGASEISVMAAGCVGRSGYTGYWWWIGYQFALNSCQTAQLIAGVTLGAAGAGVITAILIVVGVTVMAAPIAGLVTSLLVLGAAALAFCSAASAPKYAIYLNLLGYPPFAASCSGQ